jgi:hypothetical protein
MMKNDGENQQLCCWIDIVSTFNRRLEQGAPRAYVYDQKDPGRAKGDPPAQNRIRQDAQLGADAVACGFRFDNY